MIKDTAPATSSEIELGGRDQESLDGVGRHLRDAYGRLSRSRQASPQPTMRSASNSESTPSETSSDAEFFNEHGSTLKSDVAMDGTTDRLFGRRAQAPQGQTTAAIFVHAGAGYHSQTNEHIHLAACEDAARLALRVLKAGGTAVDAVETAIRVLEDKEITNAGYGSNLSIDGIVEADATIVDHQGRSGACGAVAQIKNPIHLARVILDASNEQLSLRRVPPNILVARGATDFAWSKKIPIVPHTALISRNAEDRWRRWAADLQKVDATFVPAIPGRPKSEEPTGDPETSDDEDFTLQAATSDHGQALQSATWNEGQPDSPGPENYPQVFLSPTPDGDSPSRSRPASARSVSPASAHPQGAPPKSVRRSPSPLSSDAGQPPAKRLKSKRYTPERSPLSATGSSYAGMLRSGREVSPGDGDDTTARGKSKMSSSVAGGDMDGAQDSDGVPMASTKPVSAAELTAAIDSPMTTVKVGMTGEKTSAPSHPGHLDNKDALDTESPKMPRDNRSDMINDTVGAIAIDMDGNIAAGSSSGGIGMKHRGRVGPAALVGVGSAVIPVDPFDEESVSVAAVTSGTGEHMATTMASQKCAERLYFNTRKGRGGAMRPATEEEAMVSFVENDFMDHPGVKSSHSAGAIGIMAVKKTQYGYYLHFAHNTDSFALASMHSNEKDPCSVMSRIGSTPGVTVQGARKIRIR